NPIAEGRPLLLRREQMGSEARVVQEAPEVVARVGEVSAGGGRAPAGVDAAEDDAQPGREDVGHSARAGRLRSHHHPIPPKGAKEPPGATLPGAGAHVCVKTVTKA